ncbi:MAG: polysaccharide biosynthesis tyrosine autokinase [Cypionkella sp.]|uniref:GumC family protein n=1 Tax=Cypionkella sp. TaxID=2811411 RepID=UPI002AB8395E|nr:polysaccharide biosynthesis tyrosine autokinase [Cypionkella sp.]MDZ4309647.1 polysaccharide biosynthesis tyrosine autokinase [Cypionkella sp.]
MTLNIPPPSARNAISSQRATPPDSDDTIDLIALFRTLWRGKVTILLATIAAVLIGAAYAFFIATPIYNATSVVMLETRQGSITGLDAVLGQLNSDSSAVNTEVEVLRGRTLMGRIVDELNLTADPEFNTALREPGPLARLKAVMLGTESQLEGDERTAWERAETVTALLGNIQIKNLPNSLVFQISVSSTSAEKSARIADTVSRLYIADQLRTRFEATENATTWLTNQVADLRVAFEAAESKAREFQSKTSLIDAETLGALDRQVKESRRRIEQIEGQIAGLDNQLERIAKTIEPAGKALAAGSDQLARLAQRTNQGDAAAATDFDTVLARTVMQLGQDRDRLIQQLSSLKEADRTLVSDIDRQSRDLIKLEQLQREAESSRLLYEYFETRLKETSAQQGIQKADSRILSDAVIVHAAAAPRKSLTLMTAAVLGLVSGMVLVLLQEMQANRVRSASELENLTGRIVLAQVPQVLENKRRGVLTYLQKNPTSAPAEAIRNLRTSILLSSVDSAPKVIAFTSSVPGEGKTTTTLALAQNLTAMGRKVLVIEGDVRICTLNQYFDASNEGSTILKALSGEVSLAEAVRTVPGVGDLLLAEKVAANGADLFSSEKFAKLIATARNRYDMVLIDTPPVLVVPDAKVIAQQADTTVFVVQWDRTERDQVTEALHQLDLVNIRVAGLVLSQVSPEGIRRYGYGSSYGAYASYGAKYYTSG